MTPAVWPFGLWRRRREAAASERAAVAAERANLSALNDELRGGLTEIAELRKTLAAERAALGAERASLSALNDELGRRLPEIAELWNAMDAERALLGAERASLSALNDELGRRLPEIAELWNAMDAERALLGAERASLSALNDELRRRLPEIAALRQALDADKSGLRTERGALANSQAELSALDAALRSDRSAVTELQKTLDIERAALGAERASLRDQGATFSALSVQLRNELHRVDEFQTTLSAERTALVAERDEIEARHAAEQARLVADMAYLAATLEDTRQRVVFERDVLTMRRDGLETFLMDGMIDAARKLAVCDLAILEGRIGEVVEILKSVRHYPEHRSVAVRGLRVCDILSKSGLLRDLDWSPDADSTNGPAVRQPIRFSPASGSRKVLLAFLGVGHRFWTQIAALHPFFKPNDVHVLYLRDTKLSSYMLGIDGLGSSHAEAVSGLRDLCHTLAGGEAEIFCYGTSMGGFAALRYGLDLAARRVLAIDAMTTLAEESGDLAGEDIRVLNERLGKLAVDLKPLYLQRVVIPEVSLYYAKSHGRDCAHAERFADVPKARIIGVQDGAAHKTLAQLAVSERLPEILAEFLDTRCESVCS
jgi:pimeloyl-ACP methyl ester carboxylesterase/predicted  nucleic acid-binding Zn-ribbon protein